jgi:uncharacterized RDD family membrane protein YckC
VSDFLSPPLSSDALEQLFYLHDGSGIIGPIKGSKLKEMIENGVVARISNVNLVGAPDWVPIENTGFAASFTTLAEAASSVPFAGAKAREVRSDVKFAGFWIRLGAYAIDYALTVLLVGLAGALFAVVAVSIFGSAESEAFLNNNTLAVNIIGTAIALAYYAYFSAGPWQATPGKRICGIYVVRTNGQRVDAPFAILRNFAYLLSTLPLFLGFLMIFWTDEHKALHDMICGTRVVYGKL